MNDDAAGQGPLKPVGSHPTEGPWRVQPYSWQRGNVSVFAPKFGRAPYGACVAYTPCSEGVGGAEGALAKFPGSARVTPTAGSTTRTALFAWPNVAGERPVRSARQAG